ncbi:MAG: CoA-binding protein [Marinilabiliales bacterium]|nr:MAG: CoA-binding protein [Marinilabiliales bacterium]
MSKPTLILGASPNPERYSYLATLRLNEAGHEVYPIGIKEGDIGDKRIITDRNFEKQVDTISLYVGPKNQKDWFDLIFRCKPKRIIMNPGTENPELWKMAEERGIECLEACTLVMLASKQY